jgi:assimilatory nitrate reductase catalytic subunit
MLTGAQRELTEAARMLGSARTAMVLTARGAEQHATGVNNAAFINSRCARRRGRPFSGFAC